MIYLVIYAVIYSFQVVVCSWLVNLKSSPNIDTLAVWASFMTNMDKIKLRIELVLKYWNLSIPSCIEQYNAPLVRRHLCDYGQQELLIWGPLRLPRQGVDVDLQRFVKSKLNWNLISIVHYNCHTQFLMLHFCFHLELFCFGKKFNRLLLFSSSINF